MTTPITSELIARTGAALAEGGWRYTPRQLYYATCAAAESPARSPARGELALGVLLGLVALILLPFRPAALALGALAALSLALGLVTRLTARPASGRVLGLSFAEFAALLQSLHELPGLAAPVDGAGGAAAASSTTIVCDTAENACAVACNLAHAGITAHVVTLEGPSAPRGTVIAMHDASPHGCALPLQLVDDGARVVDAGLRPAWVDNDGMQILEGAPARLPRDLSSVLSEAELDWLRSGRRAELAVLRPERLMRLLQTALRHAEEPATHSVTHPSVIVAPLAAPL